MRRPLTVAVAQPRCVAHEVAGNARAHAAVIRSAATRVVVFPELSLTGYERDAAVVDPSDRRLAPIVEACAAVGTVALVGAPVGGPGGDAHIAMLAVDGDGVRIAYRKQWVGADESSRFSPGDGPARIEVDGWRLGLAICRDTGIAAHVRDTAALGIDAYLAGTVMADDETDEQNERARRNATEQRIWVAVASFAGPTGGGYAMTAGCSGIWDPSGAVVVQAGPEPGEVVRAELT